MSYLNIILTGFTVLSFIFGVWQYLKSGRIKALNNKTLWQILDKAKRLLELIQQVEKREQNEVCEEVARAIKSDLLRAISDIHRPSDRKIRKWLFDSKITKADADELHRLNR